MYQVDDEPQAAEPVETIHLYIVREGDKKPSLVPVLISILTLSFLIAIGILTPYQQPETRASSVFRLSSCPSKLSRRAFKFIQPASKPIRQPPHMEYSPSPTALFCQKNCLKA